MIGKISIVLWRIAVLICLIFIAYCANTSLQGWPVQRLINMVTPDIGHKEEAPAPPKDGACVGFDCMIQKQIDQNLDDKVKRATP